MPRFVHLTASALWETATAAQRAHVRGWARGLLAHDGTPLVWLKDQAGYDKTPPFSDSRVAYKIFALFFDLSNRAFDYAGRERPPPWMPKEEWSTWVGSRALPPDPLPGRQPVSSVRSDGVSTRTLAEVLEPVGRPAAGEAAPAAAELQPVEGAALIRRARDPNGPVTVASGAELHAMWAAGLRHVASADTGPGGWTTYMKLDGRAAISQRVGERLRRRRGAFAAETDKCDAARRHVRKREDGGEWSVSLDELALASLPGKSELDTGRWREGLAAGQQARERAEEVYGSRERRRERWRRDRGGSASAAAAADAFVKAHCVGGVRPDTLLVCVGGWLRAQRDGRVQGSTGAHPSGAPPSFQIGLMRALRRRGVATVLVCEAYTSMHCSRVQMAPGGGGRPRRCCATVRQDYFCPPAADGTPRARPVHALLCCEVCQGGRKPEQRDYAGARGIFCDVLDVIAFHDGRHEDITSTPERWALVLAAWKRDERREREEAAEAHASASASDVGDDEGEGGADGDSDGRSDGGDG